MECSKCTDETSCGTGSFSYDTCSLYRALHPDRVALGLGLKDYYVLKPYDINGKLKKGFIPIAIPKIAVKLKPIGKENFIQEKGDI